MAPEEQGNPARSSSPISERADPMTGKRIKKTTTTKAVVWLCLVNGIGWVWCSYLLAWCGRTEIAESLSRAAVTEILGVVLAYCLKSLTENISKNNRWPDRSEQENTPDNADRDA